MNEQVRVEARKAAFTLIELLVVIVIIAILASLLLPALSRSKQLAHLTACKTHLKQWGITLQLYVNDNRIYPVELQGDGQNWAHGLERYFGVISSSTNTPFKPLVGQARTGIPECPGYLRLPGLIYNKVYPFLSYGYNSLGAGKSGGGLVKYPLTAGSGNLPEYEVKRPSNMLALGDTIPMYELPFAEQQTLKGYYAGFGFLAGSNPEGISIVNYLLSDPSSKPLTQRQPLNRAAINRRHGSKWNALFCDQHIEAFSTRSLFDIRQDQIARRWNQDNLPHNK